MRTAAAAQTSRRPAGPPPPCWTTAAAGAKRVEVEVEVAAAPRARRRCPAGPPPCRGQADGECCASVRRAGQRRVGEEKDWGRTGAPLSRRTGVPRPGRARHRRAPGGEQQQRFWTGGEHGARQRSAAADLCLTARASISAPESRHRAQNSPPRGPARPCSGCRAPAPPPLAVAAAACALHISPLPPLAPDPVAASHPSSVYACGGAEALPVAVARAKAEEGEVIRIRVEGGSAGWEGERGRGSDGLVEREGIISHLQPSRLDL
ncbi:hypothetical protein PVAP13_9KG520278 [Panicum virgatum]|uniref:Uncharacterized protein n=1 Tax=Panicum virgatum TaxID=38727 RepID=A0A8T0P1W3_PANVG|nr:hypothetical protein PVAP13_9KG520278 [Panicum virgatum]